MQDLHQLELLNRMNIRQLSLALDFNEKSLTPNPYSHLMMLLRFTQHLMHLMQQVLELFNRKKLRLSHLKKVKSPIVSTDDLKKLMLLL